MKLHAIEVDNLNSLYGLQSVDLDHAFGGASLFLIHGATGAGKSTLMDAVSLALFGETPRLDAQRGADEADPRHVMSHGAGSCHAQIEFSKLERDGTRRRYRARWACRRAHEKPDGRWQDPQRSLERQNGDDTWTLLTSSSKRKDFQPVFDDVLEGFSVHDFKRSMLLAQGQFDALLDASSEARASILERLTDTRDYKRWGQRAAMLRRAHERRLANLEARVEGRESIDLAHLSALERKKDALARTAADCDARLDAVRTALDARRRVDELALERVALRGRQRELATTEPALRRERDAAAGQRARAQARLHRASEALDSARPLVEAAIAAATALEHAQAGARERDEAAKQAEAELARARTEHLAAQRTREAEGRRLETATARRDAHPERRALVEAWPEQRRELDAQIQAWRAHGEALERWARRQVELERATTQLTDARARLDRDRIETLTPLERAVAVAREHVDGQRGDADRRAHLEALHQRETTARDEAARVRSIGAALEGIETGVRELIDTEAQASTERARRQSLAARCEDLAKARAAAGTEVEARRRAHERLARVVDLAEHRASLVPGEPCPLCGSEDHPVVDRPGAAAPEPVGELEGSRLELEAARAELQTITETHEAARHELAQLDGRLGSTEATVDATRARLRSRLLAIHGDALPDEHANTKADAKAALPAELEQARLRWSNTHTAAVAALDAAAEARKRFEDAVAALDDATAARDREALRLQSAARSVAENAASLDALRERQTGERAELDDVARALIEGTQASIEDLRARDLLDPDVDTEFLDFDPPAGGHDDRAAQAWAVRLTAWVEALDAASKTQNALHEAVRNAEQRVAEAAALERASEAACATALRSEAQATQRAELSMAARTAAQLAFDGAMSQLPPPASGAIDEGEAALEPRRLLGLLRAQVDASRCDLDELALAEHRVAARVVELEARAQELQGSLDELALRQRRAHASAEATADALRSDDDLDGAAPPRSRDALEAALESTRNEAEAARARHRDAHAQWQLVQSHLARNEQLAKELADARRTAAPWIALHQLIGRGDGDAFKTFAQALNLARLIERANVHLARLSERYRLAQVHEAGVPTLEFAVEDLFHLRRARSTRSLSGGERFLVSLALALGLSDLRTVRMPIDTLLLDEGFGTLDSETLSVALGALSQLRASGRQVGIISHVVGLRERIEAQLRVEAVGDGRSKLRVASRGGDDGDDDDTVLAVDHSAAE